MSVRSCILNSFRLGFVGWDSQLGWSGPTAWPSVMSGRSCSQPGGHIAPLTPAALGAEEARERWRACVASRRELHRNSPVLRRKAGRESDSPAQRSLGSLLCPSPLSERQEALLRKFRVKLRLKLRPAVFPLGPAVPKLLSSHNIPHAQGCGVGRSRVSVGLQQFGCTSASERAASPA